MSDKLKPKSVTLEDMLRSTFSIPVYQRPYSWEDKQVNTLLNDVLNSYIINDDLYYTGNIIIYESDTEFGKSIYNVIDGQQRMTTFSLILLAIYSLSITLGAEITDSTIQKIRDILWKRENRKNNRELKCIKLNSIEKDCFIDLYDECFERPDCILSFIEKYEYKSGFDKRLLKNFQFIYKYLENNIYNNSIENLLIFADYILQSVYFVVVEIDDKPNKVFSMFESLNGKGKGLETIDKIKSYIFSVLDESSYEIYSKKWGKLIIETNDNLYMYISTYIKAFVKFERQEIDIDIFKTICSKELLVYFKEEISTISSAIKKFIDDLIDKIDFYKMLFSSENINSLINNNQFKFYYLIFLRLEYKHPYPLFFRIFIELSKNKINKDDAIAIMKEIIIYMVKVLTISGKSSKNSISMFAKIHKNIYDENEIDKRNIIDTINWEMYVNQKINDNEIKKNIETMDAYNNKKLTVILLSWFESIIVNKSSKELKISWDKAINLLNSYGPTINIDHLLVQYPDQDSDKFKYYCNKDNELVLKEGHDFEYYNVMNKMDYKRFQKLILNRIGNLRLIYKDENSIISNKVKDFDDYSDFTSYNDILVREKEISDTVIDNLLKSVGITEDSHSTNIESDNIRIDKMLELGMVKRGDMLYISVNKDEIAELLDDRYVLYKGKKMRINDWGRIVTKWSSINIYRNVCVVGEKETLHEKRMRYKV